MKSGFLDKLIERFDRLDTESIQMHFLRLVQDRGLLETIFQSIQEGIVVVDEKGNFTYANNAAENMLGFSLETVRGRPVSGYLMDIDWERIIGMDDSEWSRILSREIEVTYPRHRYLSFYIVPLPLGNSGVTGALIMLRDVTHERESEVNLVESEKINAIKLLAAGIAHEIGNPLNSLNIHLQLLERELRKMPEEKRSEPVELLSVARREVKRLDMIITQFLRAIRPAKPVFKLCAVTRLLEETLTLLKQEIQDRDIDVEIKCENVLPEIRVDPDQIKQAFFNLIRNAFQAMPDGGRLLITVSADDYYLTVSFADSGVGIKSSDMGRIFEPYHTTKANGSGLGLMVVQRIIQEHGGQIEVASKPGAGTCFTLHLPRAERRVRLLKSGGEQEHNVSAKV